MKRIFIGSFVNGRELLKNYTQLKKDFGGILKGRWTINKNLHITYKFLGNVSEEKILEIKSVLKDIINEDIKINLTFQGISAFPNLENPKVVFIKVKDKSNTLNKIHEEIENKLSEIEFEKDNKPFIPHITVKRPKYVEKDKFINMVKHYEGKTLGSMNEIQVNIIESILTPKGAIYKKVN